MVKILTRLSLAPDARECDQHGTEFFPCGIYKTSLNEHYGRRIPEHWHGEIELGYVERGSIDFSCDRKEYILCEDDVYFIDPTYRHSMKDRSGNSIFYSIVFHEDLIAGPGAINEKYIDPVIRSREYAFLQIQDAYILSQLKNIVELGDRQAPGYELLIRNHLSSVILWICRKYEVTGAGPKPSEISAKVEKMLSFMADHYMEDIQVKQVADHAYISVRECYRAFRSELQSSPVDYLRQYRLKKAADLLVSTDLKIEEVAGRCGYNRPGYFSTSFKEMYFCSPSEYRKLNRQEKP